MAKVPRKKIVPPEGAPLILKRKTVPYKFVLDALDGVAPFTRPMFGCLAVYVKDKIVLILRDRPTSAADNGVWLATTEEHHQSLRREFPGMRSIKLLGKKVTGWQVLPSDAADFESAALHACELVLAGDPRIGKVPGETRASGSSKQRAGTARNVVPKSSASPKSSGSARLPDTPSSRRSGRSRTR